MPLHRPCAWFDTLTMRDAEIGRMTSSGTLQKDFAPSLFLKVSLSNHTKRFCRKIK
ncbi:hypothetical protein SAMN05216176_11480 [Nitratireductor indicus]|nr:hypothetical protein SAMN05216176_11480 [Nitratireductor indicus]